MYDIVSKWSVYISYIFSDVTCEQNIQNYHPADAEGHDVIEDASETMIDVAMRINEIKRQHERWLRAQEVHNALTGSQPVDVVELGDLVLEVCMTVIPIYLFIYYKNRTRSTKKYKSIKKTK